MSSQKKRVLFIEHFYTSEGGPIWEQFKNRGFEISRFLVVTEKNHKTPNVTVNWPDLISFNVLVVMGSPWGAWEDERIGNWLLPEIEKVRAAHNAGIPILGICYGGQLMARVLGGSVAKAPRSELGWFDLESDDRDFIPSGPWFQYHWDRFQVPPGGKEIARTELCSQAFTFGRTLGLQFHPEINAEVFDLWLGMEESCVEIESEGLVVEELRKQTREIEPESNKRAYDLVDVFLDRVAIAPIQQV